MPCPYYKNKMCTSPMLPEPTDAIVVPSRCLSEDKYRTCKFYVEEKGKEGKQSTLITSTIDDEKLKELRPYPPIHYLDMPIRSGCSFYKLMSYGGYFIAYCEVLGRILTRHEAKLCGSYWSSCPIAKQGYEE